jgi:hypothetical protein
MTGLGGMGVGVGVCVIERVEQPARSKAVSINPNRKNRAWNLISDFQSFHGSKWRWGNLVTEMIDNPSSLIFANMPCKAA